jgi:hypothetical protein
MGKYSMKGRRFERLEYEQYEEIREVNGGAREFNKINLKTAKIKNKNFVLNVKYCTNIPRFITMQIKQK